MLPKHIAKLAVAFKGRVIFRKHPELSRLSSAFAAFITFLMLNLDFSQKSFIFLKAPELSRRHYFRSLWLPSRPLSSFLHFSGFAAFGGISPSPAGLFSYRVKHPAKEEESWNVHQKGRKRL
jgi:hypothetical protein